MIKEKFIIDQLTTTNANLVDQIGRMQTHIENLWEEVSSCWGSFFIIIILYREISFLQKE